ncbi:MAG: MFS transporter [Actinobacteria bacterium]|nr:MAG: MFS transporter [Actinomycetota bacterium]
MTSEKRWTMLAAILGSGIVFLDSTVVNVALPRIGEELRSSFLGPFAAENFVYYGYLLSLSSLLILAGALNDYYGRRRMFTVGLIGFGATSLLCGLAPSIELLIAFRVLQGAAGALLVPGSLAIITATFEGEEQGRAFGLWAGASAATTILGPFVGGLLVETVSWRAAFFINLPLIAVALYATVAHVAESRDEEASGQFDWLGAGVIFLAVGGLSFGAIIGQQQNWHGVLPYAALIVGAVSAAAFPFLMMKSRHPLVPLGLFRSRNFTVTNISTLVIYGALYVTFAFVTIYVIGTLGYNPAAAGLIGIPGSLLLAVFSSRFGRLAARYGPRLFMAAGPAIMGLGILWFTRLPPTSHAWVFEIRDVTTWIPPATYWRDLFPGFLVFGAGLTIMVAPLTTALMTSVPKHNSGVASAINNAISRVGPQLAGALIFVAIASSFYHGIATRVPGVDTSSSKFRNQVAPLNRPDPAAPAEVKRAARAASTDAFHVGMLIAAGLLFAGAAVNGVGIRNPRAPAWMRRPKGMEAQAIPRLGPERPASGEPLPAPTRAPPWMDTGG